MNKWNEQGQKPQFLTSDQTTLNTLTSQFVSVLVRAGPVAGPAGFLGGQSQSPLPLSPFGYPESPTPALCLHLKQAPWWLPLPFPAGPESLFRLLPPCPLARLHVLQTL